MNSDTIHIQDLIHSAIINGKPAVIEPKMVNGVPRPWEIEDTIEVDRMTAAGISGYGVGPAPQGANGPYPGTTLAWIGPPDRPAFRHINPRNNYYSLFQVDAWTILNCGHDIISDNRSGVGPLPHGNRWHVCAVTGNNTVSSYPHTCWRFRRDGSDANNDLNSFFGCFAFDYSWAGWDIGTPGKPLSSVPILPPNYEGGAAFTNGEFPPSGQSKGHGFYDCHANTYFDLSLARIRDKGPYHIPAPYGVVSSGSFHWHGGSVSGSSCNFYQMGANDYCLIESVISEHSCQLFASPPNQTSFRVSLKNIRMGGHENLVSTGAIVQFGMGGPNTIDGLSMDGEFRPGSPDPVIVQWGVVGSAGTVEVKNCIFKLPNDSEFATQENVHNYIPVELIGENIEADIKRNHAIWDSVPFNRMRSRLLRTVRNGSEIVIRDDFVPPYLPDLPPVEPPPIVEEPPIIEPPIEEPPIIEDPPVLETPTKKNLIRAKKLLEGIEELLAFALDDEEKING